MSRAPSAGRKSVVPGSAGETGTAAAPGRGIVHDPAAVRALEADLDGAAVAGEGLQLAEGGVDLGDPGLDDRGDDPGRGVRPCSERGEAGAGAPRRGRVRAPAPGTHDRPYGTRPGRLLPHEPLRRRVESQPDGLRRTGASSALRHNDAGANAEP